MLGTASCAHPNKTATRASNSSNCAKVLDLNCKPCADVKLPVLSAAFMESECQRQLPSGGARAHLNILLAEAGSGASARIAL
eukprot:456216-Amphidinium_carterae.1